MGHTGEPPASAGQAITGGAARCLQNPFPAMVARAIINAVYGFFQSFPPESWRVRPRPGPAARDRASLSRRWFQRGQAPTRCVTRHSGVEPCSSGVHVDAGHHDVPGAGCWQGRQHRQHRPGGENRNRHVSLGPEPFGPTLRAYTQAALTPHATAGQSIAIRPLPHVRRRCSQTIASRHSHSPPAMLHRQAGGISLLRRHG